MYTVLKIIRSSDILSGSVGGVARFWPTHKVSDTEAPEANDIVFEGTESQCKDHAWILNTARRANAAGITPEY